MKDPIERQEAIDAICKSECGSGFCGIPCPEVNALKALPSAQPDVPDTNVGDIISRQAAKLNVARVIWKDGESCYDFHDKCVDCLDDVPSAQPERKRGHWVGIDDEPYETWECDQCGYIHECFDGEQPNFCPQCGSDMRR